MTEIGKLLGANRRKSGKISEKIGRTDFEHPLKNVRLCSEAIHAIWCAKMEKNVSLIARKALNAKCKNGFSANTCKKITLKVEIFYTVTL